MFIYIYFLFIKTISLFYSLFVFRISYKIIIIVLSSLNLAGRWLTFLWSVGIGLKLAGRAWAKHSRSGSGLGLNSSLRAWAGLEKLLRAWTLAANCGPGLGSNHRLAQGTNIYIIIYILLYIYIYIY